LGEQGGDMLSHVYRGKEVVGGNHGIHERGAQVRTQVSLTSPYNIYRRPYFVLITNSQQTRIPDPVQTMGLPLQTKPRTQECRPRPTRQRTMGLQHLPTGDASHPQRGRI